MRCVLCVCAALALCAAREPPAATPAPPLAAPSAPSLAGIKRQILAKLGLSVRPQPMRAPPRDVVRQILAHAADPTPPPPHDDHNTREIIAIAHRVLKTLRTPAHQPHVILEEVNKQTT